MLKKLIRAKFSYQFEEALLDEMAESGRYIEAGKGETIIVKGDFMRTFPMVITGLIKVIREDDEGSELLLYYLTSGETCAVSLTCCMAAQRSKVTAIIEEDAEMIVFPIRKLEEWFVRYPSWKGFVFESYQYRFEQLLESVDDLAFNRLDERLWTYLMKRHEIVEHHQIDVTHMEIAQDLNTSREVISRILKSMEKAGKIKLSRNRIEIAESVISKI